MEKTRQILEITEKLAQSEKRFREFFENAPEGITLTDINTLKFVMYNTNATKLLKYSDEEMNRIGPVELSPEFQPDGSRSHEKAQEYIMRAMNGDKQVFEWMIITGTGEKVLVEARIVLMTNFDTPHLYTSFVDITERKKKEEKLKYQNKQLAEIASLQSHQVRQPISNILGLINLFDFDNHDNPINAELILKIKAVTQDFDELIREIVIKSCQINSLEFLNKAEKNSDTHENSDSKFFGAA